MQGFFAPAIALMNRLRYPGKFVLAGALAFVSIAVLLVALTIRLYEDIRRTRHELAVTEFILPLQKQIQLTQQHRGISAAFLSGDTSMRKKLEDVSGEVDAALQLADAVEVRHSALLGSSAEWRAIKGDWQGLRAGVMGMQVGETLVSHNQLVERLLRFQLQVADTGGLSLDNEIDTYYLAGTLVNSLPEMLERLGKVRAKGTGILVRKKLTDADRIEFSVQSVLLKDAVAQLTRDLEKVGRYSPSIAPGLNLFSKDIGEATSLALNLLDTDIFGEKFFVSPTVFFDKFTQAIDIGYRELFDTLLPTLNQQLEARVFRLQTHMYLQIGVAAIFLLLLAYISFGAYFSVIESVRRLSDGAAAIAGGDLAARIHLDTRDELAIVGDSFNAMASALDEQLRQAQLAAELLNEALAAAKLADQTKDECLANMSHELRTPLNAVIGMAGLALEMSADPRQRDYLDKIATSGKHLNRIINDLLDLSKIAAGHMEFETIAFSLRDLVQRCSSVMAHRAEGKGLQLLETIDEAVPDVLLGDPLRIEQILLNLVGNAIKFTSTGRVEIRVALHAREEGRICLDFAVEDSGVGMRPEELERLFKPFSQADATVSRKFGGTGLGLAISKRLAEMMSGEISVSSVEGSGTTFRLRIWLAQDNERTLTAAPVDTEALPARYQNARVVVAEDQPLNREIVEALLAAVGVVPRMAENGQEALDILRESGADAFDLVLMDVQMPVMDGLTATRELRKLPGFGNLPIIAMTAHTMTHEKEIAAEAGVTDHIGKPFDNASFYRTLAKWIPREKQMTARATEALSQTGPTTGSALSTASGIDFVAGLSRFNGKQERYLHWLAEFVETAGELPGQIRSELAAGQSDKAAKLAHAFKGRVGMLGMMDLHRVVSTLEPALSEGAPADALLVSVEQSIARICDELAELPAFGLTSAADSEQVLEIVVWSDAYSVGVADLDRQHRKLIDMVNQLADLPAEKNAESSAVLHETLSGLFDYTQIHFRDEEDHLRRLGYTQLAAHEREHAAFIAKIANFNMAALGGILDRVGVQRYLREWLLSHILKSDMHYRRFTEENNPTL
jgi:hemerythrin-like metal-binding protein